MRLGGWLFRRRTALPVPIAVAILAIPPPISPGLPLVMAGVAITVGGEALRLWAVRHIGVISRTRTDRLGPLVDTGPFGRLRNPLYLGNIAIWVGFALTAGLLWLAGVVAVLLAAEYDAIVRWEETLLDARRGEEYRRYTARVRRWIPVPRATTNDASASSASSASSAVEPFGWRATLFSERGTLLAIAAGYLLLWLKARF